MIEQSEFSDTLAAFVGRRALGEVRAAAMLGVPVSTFRHWAAGTRAPSAAAVRLLDILGALEALAPAILAALEPAGPDAPPRPRGRPKKIVHVGQVRVNPSPV